MVLLFSALSFAGGLDDNAKGEIETFFKTYMETFHGKNIEAAVDLFAKEGAVMLGSGPGERWVGREEITAAHRGFFSSYDSEETKFTWGDLKGRNNIAWFAAMFHVTDYWKNEKNEYALNLSGTLVKEEGSWKFSILHFSNLTGCEKGGTNE